MILCAPADSRELGQLRSRYPRLVHIPLREDWAQTLLLVAGESLRRTEALRLARHAENNAARNEHHATLGRYMIDMKHSVNNALTSMLGNAELLLLEPGQLSQQSLAQIKTIHSMALRINEIMQRFSSLASEMREAENASQAETQDAVALTNSSAARRSPSPPASASNSSRYTNATSLRHRPQCWPLTCTSYSAENCSENSVVQKKVLIVDDSPSQVRLMQGLLETEGYDPVGLNDPKRIEEAITREGPSVILLDVVMPERNGFQVCRELKSNAKFNAIPVILVTSKDTPSDRYWGEQQGADGLRHQAVHARRASPRGSTVRMNATVERLNTRLKND